MENHRFYAAAIDVTDIAKTLTVLGFKELDSCFETGEPKVFIDTKKKQFWSVDDDCLVQTKQFIKTSFDEKLYPITLNGIEKWN